MSMGFRFLGVGCLLAGLCGCTYSNEEDLYPINYCDTASVTYSGSVRPIIELNCAVAGCHVPGGDAPGDYTSYTGVKARVDDGSLLPSINQSPDAVAMPPYGMLSECDIAKITEWVQQGAPQN